jgi:four helix bundle protein
LISFAVGVWNHSRDVSGDPSTRHIVEQLVRAATSTAANYAEARAAESRRDFVHKMQICLKELRETQVWLEIMRQLVGSDEARELARECDELTAIFVSSIKTARRSA